MSKEKQCFPTMASDLIKQLQNIVKEVGDCPVAMPHEDYGMCATLFADLQPYYWDGGYSFKINNGNTRHFENSVDSTNIPASINKKLPYKNVIKLISYGPDDWFDTFDGVPVVIEEDDCFVKDLMSDPDTIYSSTFWHDLEESLPYMTEEFKDKWHEWMDSNCKVDCNEE